jgi:hypothetical protein
MATNCVRVDLASKRGAVPGWLYPSAPAFGQPDPTASGKKVLAAHDFGCGSAALRLAADKIRHLV